MRSIVEDYERYVQRFNGGTISQLTLKKQKMTRLQVRSINKHKNNFYFAELNDFLQQEMENIKEDQNMMRENVSITINQLAIR